MSDWSDLTLSERRSSQQIATEESTIPASKATKLQVRLQGGRPSTLTSLGARVGSWAGTVEETSTTTPD